MIKLRSAVMLTLGLIVITLTPVAFANSQANGAPVDSKETIGILNDLIETAKNGQEGYKVAASGVDDPKTKASLLKLSEERGQFVTDLKGHVVTLGGDPEKGSSPLGAAHRGWISVKAAASNKDESAILAECKKGDEAAIKNYESALDKNLPETVRSVVQNQLEDIKSAYNQVAEWEGNAKVDHATKEAREEIEKAEEKADENIVDAKAETQGAY